MKKDGFFEKVYAAVRKIPNGKVATYGQIATVIGSPRAARQVGWALHVNPYFGDVPCHRVVNRFGDLSGAFAFGGIDTQEEMLKAEGIQVVNGKVDLDQYLYQEWGA